MNKKPNPITLYLLFLNDLQKMNPNHGIIIDSNMDWRKSIDTPMFEDDDDLIDYN